MSSGELFGWSVGKPFLVGVRSVRAGLKKMTLAVSLRAEVMWVSVSACFSGESFPFFFTVNVSFSANFNQIDEINL